MHEIIPIKETTLVFSPFKNIKTTSLGIFLPVGSRIEHKKKKGIAHFLEHMVFKGTKNYSYRKIKTEIEGRGGSLNGFTSQEVTAYYAHFLNKNLNLTLDILIDMVLCPLLQKSEINKERNVILEEIKMYNDIPASRAMMLLDQLLWRNHSLGQEVIGYSSTVRDIDGKDLENFQTLHYIPSNMVISFCGDFPKEKLIDLVNKKIKKQKKKSSSKKIQPSFLRGLHIKVENRPIEQAHLCLGFRSNSYKSTKRITAKLLNIILGANMSSRLFEELREKRPLCYDISTELKQFCDSGGFVIHAGLDKRKIILALQTIVGELDKIKNSGVSFTELSRAKDYLLGQITMSLEQPQGKMFYLADSLLKYKKIEDFKKLKSRVVSVTEYDIQGLAKDIFNLKNMCISCVGDVGDDFTQRLKKAL